MNVVPHFAASVDETLLVSSAIQLSDLPAAMHARYQLTSSTTHGYKRFKSASRHKPNCYSQISKLFNKITTFNKAVLTKKVCLNKL